MILIIATQTSGLFSTVFHSPIKPLQQSALTNLLLLPIPAEQGATKSVHQLDRWLLPRSRRVSEVTAIAMRFKLFATRSTKMASSVFIN